MAGFYQQAKYIDTDISKADCDVGCGAAIVFSVTKKF
jgi:hypothetical protein